MPRPMHLSSYFVQRGLCGQAPILRLFQAADLTGTRLAPYNHLYSYYHCRKRAVSTLTLDILNVSPQGSQFRREDLKPGECLCTYCTAKCCRYFALGMDQPTAWRDFDHMRWFLTHEGPVCSLKRAPGICWYIRRANTCGGQPLRHLRNPAANLSGLHDRQVRVRRRLGVRPLLGNGRAGRGVRGSRHGTPPWRGFSQQEAIRKVFGRKPTLKPDGAPACGSARNVLSQRSNRIPRLRVGLQYAKKPRKLSG